MNEILVGYARVSTEQQDLTAQRDGLHALGVGDDRIYVDHGLTGTNRDRRSPTAAMRDVGPGDKSRRSPARSEREVHHATDRTGLT
jgi:DNA invertase Pin-like site-specific DNA recombinase